MSTALHFPRLARMVVLGATGCAVAGFLFLTSSPSVARALTPSEASAQDPYGQDPNDGSGLMPLDDGMPFPTNRRRAKAVRKKVTGAEKTKKADSAAKDKSASKSGSKKASGAGDAGKLKFSQDIAPILVANCTGCHSGDGNGLRKGKLDLSTFEKMQSRKVVEPGNPDESKLVLRIKGEIEPKMPQGANAALSAAAIAKIERWIKEGAALDTGNDPKKPMASYAASADQVRRAELSKLPVGERDKKTEEVGIQRFKQANAALKPEVVRTEHFMIFSTLPKDRANSTLKVLETQFGHLKRILGTSATESPEKVSIYAFSSRKDFIEFIRTVEARPDVDTEETTSARFSVPQPYVAVIDPQGGQKDEPGTGARRKGRGRRGEEKAAEGAAADRSLQGLLTESVVAAVVGSAGNPPRWLAFGIGTYLAAQVEPRSAYYRQLRQTAFANWQQGWPTRANEALGGSDQLTPDGLHAIAFAFVEAMMSPDMKQGFPTFANGMLGGTEKLDDMLQRVYRATREEFINYSGEWVTQRYGQLQ